MELLPIVALCLHFFTTGTYGQCTASLRNTAVYAGTKNTVLSCAAGPSDSAWSVMSTSSATDSYRITNFSNVVSPTLKGLYGISQSGLTVRDATMASTDDPISTAGIYSVQFASNTNLISAKLVVIQSDPISSCDQSASNDGVDISYSITYADHPVAPIEPILTCTANGQSYKNDAPSKTSVSTNVNIYSLTITVNDNVPKTYACQVTFASPMRDPRYPNIARNTPDFKETFTVYNGATCTISKPTKDTSATGGLSNGGKIGIGSSIGGVAACILFVVFGYFCCSWWCSTPTVLVTY